MKKFTPIKKVSTIEYNNIMTKIMSRKLPIQKILIKMLEEASKYRIRK